MKKTFALVLVSFAAFAACALAGCNTISGMGKDIQGAGRAIQGAGGR